MKKTSLFLLILFMGTMNAQARLYRWTDENGNVQYGDRPPPANARNVSELDRRGIVRKAPEKPLSEEEYVRQEAARRAALEQTRRDKALLDSFGTADEIDVLRDRQISAVKARQQANQVRSKDTQAQLKQWLAQSEALSQKKKAVPESLRASIETARKEVARLEAESKKMSEELVDIAERAEADKKRFIELRGPH